MAQAVGARCLPAPALPLGITSRLPAGPSLPEPWRELGCSPSLQGNGFSKAEALGLGRAWLRAGLKSHTASVAVGLGWVSSCDSVTAMPLVKPSGDQGVGRGQWPDLAAALLCVKAACSVLSRGHPDLPGTVCARLHHPFRGSDLRFQLKDGFSKQMEANVVFHSGLHQLLLRYLPRVSESKMICIIYVASPLFLPLT